ncbi:hypothetical protein PC9H_000875 [Pleurotus ostreatus]|uniref:ferric-chelate reductase (NADPH) n=1 Tax=Pleurotus ostreatus TaxID=5322 RepID=A0A8H7A4B9_PLEOS|nr:uncharacterized protein PC9H_000875 [Pleurotus ostreatus]KAF7440529.1 hypothetical protein PC9H_000875 [Pleurotus ostreatus]KAJ8700112.1 hypothetical protein PTI98_003168 [Pleurotus ostreatus]
MSTPIPNSTPTATVIPIPNPTTPNYPDDIQWITAYLVIHMLSPGSFWYAYLLWFVVAAIFLLYIFLRWTGSGGYLGARWNKWALRKRTWRGQHALAIAKKRGTRPQPKSLPSNGQIFCTIVLFVAVLLLCFVGPDYIGRSHSSIFARRDGRRPAYSISDFIHLQPQYQINKAWWTSGNRTGVLAFALLPLCVLFALKAPPFALFAIPFTTQFYFDKLSWLHRWSGRLIWMVSALHVLLWSVQLSLDRREGTGVAPYVYIWRYPKFIYGWTAFMTMTALIGLSTSALRKQYYQVFYACHIMLVPLTIIMAALHHPPVWWWCWGALSLWVGERIWRATWWLYNNGFLGSSLGRTSNRMRLDASYPEAHYGRGKRHIYPPLRSSYGMVATEDSPFLSLEGVHSYTPPPGFSYAELLSGSTVRLTFLPPGPLAWAPGQHFLLTIPSISRLDTHPFTAASICDEQASTAAGRALVFYIRAKEGWTKDLWNHVFAMLSHGETHVASEKVPFSEQVPSNGVLLRTLVDGPFGSSIRTQWRQYSTVLVVVGGSGVSFGVSILQFLALCLAGRDGKYLGGHPGGWGSKDFKVRRVRFVWIIREYSHVQWCASILQHCMTMMPAPSLDVDIFVTNPTTSLPKEVPTTGDIELPNIVFEAASEGGHHSDETGRKRRDSVGSVDSDYHQDDYIDPNPDITTYGDEGSTESGNTVLCEIYTLYLTNFEGDQDIRLPGEAALNKSIRKSGKMRRAKSRMAKKEGNGELVKPMPSTSKGAITQFQASSPDGLLSPTWRTANQIAESLKDTAYRPLSSSRPTSPRHPPDPRLQQPSPSPSKVFDGDSEAPPGALQILVDAREMHDISVVSEHARLGKPKLDRILADEVRMARGPVIVATCGPASLNAMVRKEIAKQIDPAKIRGGDMSGFIDLVSEEFDF